MWQFVDHFYIITAYSIRTRDQHHNKSYMLTNSESKSNSLSLVCNSSQPDIFDRELMNNAHFSLDICHSNILSLEVSNTHCAQYLSVMFFELVESLKLFNQNLMGAWASSNWITLTLLLFQIITILQGSPAWFFIELFFHCHDLFVSFQLFNFAKL